MHMKPVLVQNTRTLSISLHNNENLSSRFLKMLEPSSNNTQHYNSYHSTHYTVYYMVHYMRFWVIMTINMQITVSQALTPYPSIDWYQHFNFPTLQGEAAHSFRVLVPIYYSAWQYIPKTVTFMVHYLINVTE